MLCDELYKLAERYLSKEGQKLVEELVADEQILSAQGVLVGGVLAKGNQIAPEDQPLVYKLLRDYSGSLQDLT